MENCFGPRSTSSRPPRAPRGSRAALPPVSDRSEMEALLARITPAARRIADLAPSMSVDNFSLSLVLAGRVPLHHALGLATDATRERILGELLPWQDRWRLL